MRQIIRPLMFLVIVMLVGCEGTPDSNQIKADLIGKAMGNLLFGQAWIFESPSEFKEFTINSKHKEGRLLEYDISMLLQELKTGKKFRAEALVVYRRVDNKWQVANIVSKSLQEVK